MKSNREIVNEGVSGLLIWIHFPAQFFQVGGIQGFFGHIDQQGRGFSQERFILIVNPSPAFGCFALALPRFADDLERLPDWHILSVFHFNLAGEHETRQD